jgi:membrane protein
MAGVFVAWVAFDAVVRALGAQALGLPGGTLVLSTLGLFALVALGAGLLFRQVPDARVPWRAVWPGAIATGALLAIAKFAFSLYLGFTRLAVVYGAAGSLAALLIWVFVSWLGLLAGAAIARAWAELNGLPITPASTADGVRQAVPGLARGEARAEEAARRLWPRNRPRTPR